MQHTNSNVGIISVKASPCSSVSAVHRPFPSPLPLHVEISFSCRHPPGSRCATCSRASVPEPSLSLLEKFCTAQRANRCNLQMKCTSCPKQTARHGPREMRSALSHYDRTQGRERARRGKREREPVKHPIETPIRIPIRIPIPISICSPRPQLQLHREQQRVEQPALGQRSKLKGDRPIRYRSHPFCNNHRFSPFAAVARFQIQTLHSI